MRKIVIFFLVLLLVLMFSACASFNMTDDSADDTEPLKLAIMEFEDLSGTLSKSMLSVATEQIRGKFVSSNKFIVIAKERQEKAMITKMKEESYKDCNDKNCQIPLGQALSADTILRTTITFFGGSYTIISELIDLEKEATVKGTEATFDGSEKSLKEAINSIVTQIAANKQIKFENSDDELACESAKTENSISTWKQYLDDFPRGGCASLARETIDRLACAHAERTNSMEGWQLYLKHQSRGKCSFKAKGEIKKLQKKYLEGRKIGKLIWSDYSSTAMDWNAAKQYCKDLTEGGFTDWQLPNINELRTLVKGRKTMTGGACKVSKTCSSSMDCWSWETCAEACRNYSWYNCSSYNDGRYSKLGDITMFWSSTSCSRSVKNFWFELGETHDEKNNAWIVNFSNGSVTYSDKSNNRYVRCVR